MTTTPGDPAEADYRAWLTADPEPGWYDPGEGHRIQTAFHAGWQAGAAYLAAAIRDEFGAPYLPEVMVAELLGPGEQQAPPPGPSPA